MSRRYQSGYSLLGVLISIAMAAFVMTAVIKAYVSSKQAFNNQAALSAVAENGRFALSDIRRVLLMAGRNIAIDDTDSDGKLLYEEPVGDFGSSITDGTSDSIAVWYATGSDCHGSAISSMTLSEFSIANGNLQCTVGNSTRTLVSGVETMQILYGIDSTTGGDNYADQYFTATQLDAVAADVDPDIWKKLVSVRIAMVASSEGGPSMGMERETPPTFTVLDQTYTPTDNSKMYRAFSATVSLRNMNGVNR